MSQHERLQEIIEDKRRAKKFAKEHEYAQSAEDYAKRLSDLRGLIPSFDSDLEVNSAPAALYGFRIQSDGGGDYKAVTKVWVLTDEGGADGYVAFTNGSSITDCLLRVADGLRHGDFRWVVDRFAKSE